MSTIKNSSSIFNLIIIISIIIVYSIIFLVTTALNIQVIMWSSITYISTLSLIIFLVSIYISLYNYRFYYIILIFQLLAQPSAVDDFFPGVFWGSETELLASVFPFLTHIDLFILIGILKYGVVNRKFILRSNTKLTILVVLLFSSFLVNLFTFTTPQGLLLLFLGSFQMRIFILLYILLIVLPPPKLSDLILSFAICIYFLFFEAVVYSSLSGFTVFKSGSLGINTFANIIAAIVVVLILYLKVNRTNFSYKLFCYGSIFIGILIILFTGTRMALFSFILAYLIIRYFYKISSKRIINSILVITFLVISVLFFSKMNIIPYQYQIWNLVNFEDARTVFSETSLDSEVRRTPETSSIITRYQLFRTSINMFYDNPIFGIGVGRWNYLKDEYGFDSNVLIDSHNGYLALISQYGIIGIYFIYIVFVWPVRSFFKKIRTENLSGYYIFGALSLTMALAEISNAGIFKLQVFSLLAFVTILIHYKQDKN